MKSFFTQDSLPHPSENGSPELQKDAQAGQLVGAAGLEPALLRTGT